MRRWLARMGLGLLGAVVTIGLLILGLGLLSLPRYDGRVALVGLEAPAVILRDAYAVPTIQAASEADAYRTLGFAHGQDRLWQIELARRAGRGQLSELLGAGALPTDRFMRMLGLARLADASVAHLDPTSRKLLEAYVEGVNAGATDRTVLPPEFLILRSSFAPWTVADSLLFGRLMALELSQGWWPEVLRSRLARALTAEQLRDLFPDQPASPRTVAALGGGEVPLPELSGLGSNIFAAGGRRTASGRPILASDPHLGLRMPGHWYLARLEAPGLVAMGGTIPGLPTVVIGRNADVAWGFTNTGADTEDLFVERLDPADSQRYLTPEGSLPFVQVDGVRHTRHGPVISDVLPELAPAGAVVALAWAALEEDEVTPAAGFDLARARDVGEVREALRRFTSPVQNAVFADRQGNIGFLTAGRIPIRRSGNGSLPADGASGEQDWIGWIPFDELPQVMRPADDLIVNANNRVVGADYPHLITSSWEGPMRAARILELLKERRDLHADDAAAIQLDQLSGIARVMLPLLRDLRGRNVQETSALELLRHWNGIMAADGAAPLLFAGWYTAFRQSLASDELGSAADLLRNPSADQVVYLIQERPAWCDDVRTPIHETCSDLALLALGQALPALGAAYGDDLSHWRWGDAHRAQLTHEPFGRIPALAWLFNGTPPVGGDGTTVNVAAWRDSSPGGPFPATHMAGLRIVADLASDTLAVVTSTGQSGHPFSRHLDDLTTLWTSGRQLELGPPKTPTSRLVLDPARPAARLGG